MLCIGALCYNIGLQCRYAKITKDKNDSTPLHSRFTQKQMPEVQFRTKGSVLIFYDFSGIIWHAGLFFTGQLRNP